LFKESDIIVVMKIARLRWAGHVIRISYSEMPNIYIYVCVCVYIYIYMNYNLEGKRRVRRPTASLTDAVDKDMRKADVRNW
jgi:hypothetical protein